MKKKSILRKWWSPLIPTAIIVMIIGGTMWANRTPTYTYPKTISTYSVDKLSKSPDDVASAFLRSIYDEDVAVFKQCAQPKLVDIYSKLLYDNKMTDEEWKGLLHSGNLKIKSEYKENWYEDLKISGVSEPDTHGFVKINIKYKNEDFNYPIYTMHFKSKYYVLGSSINQFFDEINARIEEEKKK